MLVCVAKLRGMAVIYSVIEVGAFNRGMMEPDAGESKMVDRPPRRGNLLKQELSGCNRDELMAALKSSWHERPRATEKPREDLILN